MAKKNLTVVSPAPAEDRKKAARMAAAAVQKRFGEGAIMRLGQKPSVHVDVIPTGSMGLDFALGVGGLPRGRIVEIYGPESSGKTTLALHIVAEAQKLGGEAAFIDAEHALDPEYARALGVNIDELFVSQPDCGEQALEICDTLVRSGGMDVVIVDSVAALVPQVEIDGEMGEATVGLLARLMSQAMRKLAGAISKTNTLVVFLNQLRDQIGAYKAGETTTGGRALKFYSSVRLEVRRVDSIEENKVRLGNIVRVRTVKNKVAPPFRTVLFSILFGKGIDRSSEVLSMAEELRIFTRSGSWYYMGDTRIGQGRDSVRKYLADHPGVARQVEDQLKAHSGQLVRVSGGDDDDQAAGAPVQAESMPQDPFPMEDSEGYLDSLVDEVV